MKKIFLCLAIGVLLGMVSPNFRIIAFASVTVYTYESMEWIQEKVLPLFEQQKGIQVNVVKLGDAGNILSRLLLEKKNPRADVVLGLDQSLGLKAIQEGLLQPFTPSNLQQISNKELIFDSSGCLFPYDYGALAFVYDPEKFTHVPDSFTDLILYPRSILLQDPRSSSTGQAFLLWTIAVYGEGWKEFWKTLKPAILTVTSGWSESFAKFEMGEAPMMLSYATDGAYAFHYYQSQKYGTFIPKEGAYLQIEGVGIVSGTKNIREAEMFVEFVLSDVFQKEIPLNQWMFPIRELELPEAFQYAIIPEKILTFDYQKVLDNLESWLSDWEEVMYQK